MQPVPVADPVAERRAAELERQRLLAEEVRRLDEERAARRRAEREEAEAAAAARAVRPSAVAGGFVGELRDAASARRAIVLREILGTPVGLR